MRSEVTGSVDVDTSKREAIGSELVAALERSWLEVRRRHHDVPEAVIILSSREGSTYGHFSFGRWIIGDDRMSEVMITAEGLRLAPAKVLETLIHEAAHGLAATRRIKDTSRGGRYHNKRFAGLAEELGLAVVEHPQIGFTTAPPDDLAEDYAATVEDLGKALIAHRELDVPLPRQSTGNRWLAAKCCCPRRIKAAQRTLDEAPITCGLCECDFAV